MEAGRAGDRARAAAAGLAVVAGLAAVDALFSASAWSWLLWIGVGSVAGGIAGKARWIWSAWAGVALFYVLRIPAGLGGPPGPFWVLGAVIGAGLVGLGFMVGTRFGRRPGPAASWRSAWQVRRRTRRRLAVGVLVAGLVAFVGYTTYVGVEGTDRMFNASRSSNCQTPASRYGWAYEAINYDQADDLRLAAENPSMDLCRSQGAKAGGDVVTSDGIRIAGWYIPAANDVGPTGPTILIAHGGSSNKSEFLPYAVPFHDVYNVLLVDLRNAGRSGDAATTLGVRERLDIAAMVDWLERTKHPTRLGAVGNSMGAAAILAAAVDDDRIEALVLDSMHASFVGVWAALLETEGGQPSLPGSLSIALVASLRLGVDVTSVDPVSMIARLGRRPVLLLHGTDDRTDVPGESAERNFHAALAAGVPVELHYCQGAGHAQVLAHCPKDWDRVATSFMDAALRPGQGGS